MLGENVKYMQIVIFHSSYIVFSFQVIENAQHGILTRSMKEKKDRGYVSDPCFEITVVTVWKT